MIKIVSLDILDLIEFPSGILFVLREQQGIENVKVAFYCYDIDTNSIASVTKNAYLLTKFGSSYNSVASQLGDYVSCDTARIKNGQLFVIYSSGEIGFFDEQGNIIRTDDLKYNDSPARDAAVDSNNNIWSVVPEQNVLVRYSTQQNRITLRLGADADNTFSCPVSVVEYDGFLYVCNADSKKIRRVDLSDYSVEDYKSFDESVYKYIRVGEHEFVVLDSGVYLL